MDFIHKLSKLILYIKAKEDQLAFFITSVLDISQGSSRIILAALQCSVSNALKPSLFVRPPHTDIPYTIDGIITLNDHQQAGEMTERFNRSNSPL